MKQTLTLLLSYSLLSTSALAQCTISGLNSVYCETDSAVIVSVDSTNGYLVGQGITDSIFDPTQAGPGVHVISFIDTTSGLYTVLQNNGSYGPLPDTGTQVALLDDDVSNLLPIGFTFKFFGVNYTQFRISSNGFITFENTLDDGCCGGDVIPDAATPNNYIGYNYDDLDPTANGTISYYTTGLSPNRKLIISFTDLPYWSNNTGDVKSQVVLSESTNIIEIHSDYILAGGPQTMGIEDQTGATGYAVPGRNSQTWSVNDDYVAFYPGSIECSDTVQVLASPTLNLTSSVDTACPGTPITLTAASNGDTHNWSPATGLSSTTTSSTIANIASTETYTVVVTDTTTGCSRVDSIQVNIYLPPQPNLGPDTIVCNDSYIILDPGFGYVSYDWNDNSSNQYLVVDGQTEGVGTHIYTVTVTDQNGCTATDQVQVTVNDCVGLEEYNIDNFFTVFPNPNQGNFAITLNSNVIQPSEIEILNQEGKLIRKQKITGTKVNFDISQEGSGVYMILMRADGKLSTQKVIVE